MMDKGKHQETRERRCPIEMLGTFAGGVAGIVGSLILTVWATPACLTPIIVPLQLMGAALFSHWLCTEKNLQSTSHKQLLRVLTGILAGISLILLLFAHLPDVAEWLAEMTFGCAIPVFFYTTEPSNPE